MEQLRFGIVGTGTIAHRFAEAIKNTQGAVLAAVALRTKENAERFGSDTKVITSGLTNDEIGYVMPDTDCADNFLTKSLISDMGCHVGRANNEVLMSASKEAGSSLVEAFADLFETNAKK